MENKYVVVCPQFVDGTNLQYLTDYLCDYMKDEVEYITINYDVSQKRGGSGFYNFDTWLLHEAENVKRIIKYMNKTKDDDAIYTYIFIDYWSPSAVMSKIHSVVNNIHNCKFIGWYHGSSTLPGDYFDLMFPTERKTFEIFEISLNGLYNQIWAASNYFTSGIPNVFKIKTIKIGEPFNPNDYIDFRYVGKSKKRYDVVINARLDRDKIDFENMMAIIKALPDVSFLIISPVTNREVGDKLTDEYLNLSIMYALDEKFYLEILSSCKIVLSVARQEGWGYAVMKAVTVGCIPVVPNLAVYPELYEFEYLYRSINDAIELIKKYLDYYPVKTFVPQRYGLENFLFNKYGLLERRI